MPGKTTGLKTQAPWPWSHSLYFTALIPLASVSFSVTPVVPQTLASATWFCREITGWGRGGKACWEHGGAFVNIQIEETS